jgi:hypothetical protein
MRRFDWTLADPIIIKHKFGAGLLMKLAKLFCNAVKLHDCLA